MANHSKNNLLVGAAVAAGLLGTLTSILIPKKLSQKNWTDQAKGVADMVGEWRNWSMDNRKDTNKNLFLGGIAGSLLGITTALLLAPKSGSDLIKDFTRSFQHTVSRTVHRSKSAASRHKKTHATVKHRAAAASRVNRKTSSTSVVKKSRSPKKRTTSKRAKHAAASTEKHA